MHNAMLPDYLICMVLLLRYDKFRHAQSILKNALSWVHTPETTAASSSWKKTPIGIRVSVSKAEVTFFLWYCSQTEAYSDCLLRFLDHKHNYAHTG